MAYQPKVYRDNGGDKLTVASGGEIDIESGGAWKIAGVQVTASAAALNTASGGSTGTTSATYTIDSDSSAAKLKLDTNSATGDFTLSVVPPNLGADVVLTLPSSTGTIALTSDTATNLDLGSSGVAGSLDIFPTTAANGKLTWTATDMGGAWNLSITNDAIAAARNYTIPDAGGHGKFVMTTANNSLLVNANGGDRTMSVAGNLTFPADLTISGAHATTIVVPAAHTYTLPDADCTLAADTTGSTGTTSAAYTIDSDSATGKFVLRTNAVAGTDNTVTVSAPTTTQDVALALPDVASDTLVSKTSTDVLTNKTLTAPVINGATTAAAANNFSLHTGSGAFTTPTGIFTFYGAVSTNGNNNYNFGGSSGVFTTSTGTNTLSGNVVIPANKTFDASASNGTFKTSTGTNTLGGDVSVASGKNLSGAGGASAVDFSGCSGTFKSSTGANTLGGNVVIADGKYLKVGSAAGGVANAIQLYSATAANGSVILHQPDNAGNFSATVQPDAALGQGTTYQLPDPGGANGEIVVTTGANQLLVNCNAGDRTMSLAGNVTLAAALTTAGANALTLTTTGVTGVTLPTAGTLATLGGTETLTNKVIDGDDNTLQDIGPAVAKSGVEGDSVPTAAVPSMPFVISYETPNGAAADAAVYTIPAGKTLRVLNVTGYKAAQAGGAAGTLAVQNVATAITDNISLNINDKATFSAATIDDAQRDVAAGTAIKITTATAAACNLEAIVNIWCMWV